MKISSLLQLVAGSFIAAWSIGQVHAQVYDKPAEIEIAYTEMYSRSYYDQVCGTEDYQYWLSYSGTYDSATGGIGSGGYAIENRYYDNCFIAAYDI
jgi:hypothetical protein